MLGPEKPIVSCCTLPSLKGFKMILSVRNVVKLCFMLNVVTHTAIGAQASTLQTRRLWKAYNRATEVSMAVDGTRRQRT